MCFVIKCIMYSNKVFFLEASKTNFHSHVDFGEQTCVQRASSMNGESEKCLLHRSHGEDGTRDNVPSPGMTISVSPGLPSLLASIVILEFPAACKLVSDLTGVSVDILAAAFDITLVGVVPGVFAVLPEVVS